MLRFLNQITGQQILSLRDGKSIAETNDIVIDPDRLHVAAVFVTENLSNQSKVLFTEDIREYSNQGLIVDSEDNLMELEGLVRLEKLIAIDFKLKNKKVITDRKRKVGKVNSAVFNDKSFLIEKLYVKPPALKLLGSSELIVGRKQIVEVNDQEIIVKDSEVKIPSRTRVSLTNPLSSQAQS